jgi:tetratricopeptide (TPR) repeat protein
MFAESCKSIADHIPVIFEIHIDPKFAIHRLASIEDISTISEEKEVLFSMQAICRVVDINPTTDGIQYIRLSLTDDDDPQLRELTEYMTQEVSGPTLMHRLGPLFVMLEQWSEAEHIYETLLEETDEDDITELADLHYQLGYIADRLNSSEEAFEHYHEVLDLLSNLTENERHQLAPTYAGIARLHYQKRN